MAASFAPPEAVMVVFAKFVQPATQIGGNLLRFEKYYPFELKNFAKNNLLS